MSGKCSLISLIIFHLLLLSKGKYLVLTVDFHHLLPLLMTSENWIDSNKYHTKEPFVIFFGVIQMKDLDLMSVQEVQAGHSVK